MKELREKFRLKNIGSGFNAFMNWLSVWVGPILIANAVWFEITITGKPGFSFLINTAVFILIAWLWKNALERIFGRTEEIRRMQMKIEIGVSTLSMVRNASPKDGNLYHACARAIELMEEK